MTPSPLADRADALRRRVVEHDRRAVQGHLAQGLTTRRDELARVVRDAQEVVGFRDVLRAAGVGFVINQDPLRQMAVAVGGVEQQFADEPASLTRPNALDLSRLHQVIAAARQTLAEAWGRHVNAPADDRLADVLEAVPRFAVAGAQLRGVYADLRRAAARLPQNDAAVRVPAQLRARATQVVNSLQLGEAVLALLGRVQRDGVSLADLLADPSLIEALRTHHILECLRVVI